MMKVELTREENEILKELIALAFKNDKGFEEIAKDNVDTLKSMIIKFRDEEVRLGWEHKNIINKRKQ